MYEFQQIGDMYLSKPIFIVPLCPCTPTTSKLSVRYQVFKSASKHVNNVQYDGDKILLLGELKATSKLSVEIIDSRDTLEIMHVNPSHIERDFRGYNLFTKFMYAINIAYKKQYDLEFYTRGFIQWFILVCFTIMKSHYVRNSQVNIELRLHFGIPTFEDFKEDVIMLFDLLGGMRRITAKYSSDR